MSKFSVAPMMNWTDRHCRYFHRLLSKNVELYTEMITTGAILFGDRNRLLDFDESERPLVLQVGGSDPSEMSAVAKIAQDWGYDGVNINAGCPSDRVQSGSFGACLMQTPDVVADCISAMRGAVDIPISVKSRIGVDDMEGFDDLVNFISIVENAGCQQFIIHARKAWLKGLSPKQNRSVPPLNYEWVYQIKRDFPQLFISINGGIIDMQSAVAHLQNVDGVMLGRVVYHQPYLLAQVDGLTLANISAPSREQILVDFMAYMQAQYAKGVPVRSMTRHILGLYHGQANARKFRQLLSGKTVEFRHLEMWLEMCG